MRKMMLLTGACAALAAWSDVVSWTGSQGGYWTNTASWAGGALPGASDTADFSALGDNKTIIVDDDVLVDSLVKLYKKNTLIYVTGDGNFNFNNDLDVGAYREDFSKTNDVWSLNNQNILVRGRRTGVIARKIEGNAKFSAYSAAAINVASPQVGGGITFRANGGDVDLRNDPFETPLRWNFEDAANPAAHGEGGLAFTTVEGVSVVNDAERGNVLQSTASAKFVANIGNNANFPAGDSPFTVSLWVNVPTTAGAANDEGTFVSWGARESNFGMMVFRFNTSYSKLVFSFWGGTYDFVDIALPHALNDGKWHHLAARYDRSEFTVFCDGEKLGWVQYPFSCVPLAVHGNGTLAIACDHHAVNNARRRLNGRVDDVCVWKEALPDKNILAIARGEEVAVTHGIDGAPSLEIDYAGAISLGANARVGDLSGNAVRGELKVRGGAVTVEGTGAANEKTTFEGAVVGDADLVKRGAGYNLVLRGASEHTGATRVEEGTLTLEGACVVRHGGVVDPSDAIGFWCFDDPSNDWADSGSNGITLEPTTQTIEDDAEVGRVARFDGNGMASASMKGTIVGNSPYTISVWAKVPVDCNNDAGTFISIGDTTLDAPTYRMICFRFQENTVYSELVLSHYGVDFQHIKIPNGLHANDGEWHHYAAVYDPDGGRYYVYFDGEACVFSGNGNTPYAPKPANNINIPSSASVHLGRHYLNTNRNFKGDMDDVAVWKRALDAQEVRSLFEKEYKGTPGAYAEISPKDALPRPVLEYTFDDASDIGRDSSTNAFHLTLVGNASTVESQVSPLGGKMLYFKRWPGTPVTYLARAAGAEPAFSGAIPLGGEEITFTAWARWDDLSLEKGSRMASIGGTGAEGTYIFDIVGDRYRFCGVGPANGGSVPEYSMYADNINFNFGGMSQAERFGFVHYAATYSKKNGLKLYINGVLQGTTGVGQTTAVAAKGFTIGGRVVTGTSAGWNGWIDEVKLYDRELTEAQVRTVMRVDAGKDGVILPEGGAIEIAEGASLVIDRHVQNINGICGEGVLALGAQGCAKVTDDVVFGGDVVGNGVLSVEEGARLTLTKGLAGFAGDVLLNGGEIDLNGAAAGGSILLGTGGKVAGSPAMPVWFGEGTDITLDAGTALPFAEVSGAVHLADGCRIAWRAGEKVTPGDYVLARGTSVEGDASGWTLDGFGDKHTVKIKVTSGGVVLRVLGSGTVLIVR